VCQGGHAATLELFNMACGSPACADVPFASFHLRLGHHDTSAVEDVPYSGGSNGCSEGSHGPSKRRLAARMVLCPALTGPYPFVPRGCPLQLRPISCRSNNYL
jgi:hypothetical protein